MLIVLSCLLFPAGAFAETASGNQVNINTASEEELQTVPGIGKVLSKRIVEFRDEHGPFRKVEDIMKVRGIGEKSFEKIRPYLSVGKAK